MGADPGVGLRPLACWDWGFESRRWNGCLSLVTVVCYYVEVSATGWSLVQRCPTDYSESFCVIYRGADKSLARPGRKQARKHVRDARDFNKIEMRAVIKYIFLLGKASKEIHAILTGTLACFLPSRAKDLSAPL